MQWRLVVVALITVLGIAGGLLVRDVAIAHGALLDARTHLGDVADALSNADLEEARRAAAEAGEAIDRARSHTDGWRWSVVGSVPVVGDSIEAVHAIVAVADAAGDVAEVAVSQGSGLVEQAATVDVVEGRLDLAGLQEARELIRSLPVERLVEARRRLVKEPRWAPEPLLLGRLEALELADRAITTVDRVGELLDASLGFLAVDEPRRYFLGVQTPGELRGTGGLIGYWAVLEVDEGQLGLTGGEIYEPLDDLAGLAAPRNGDTADGSPQAAVSGITELYGDVWDGVPTTSAFHERYGHTAASGFFSNVNVDPDLPTTARVALDLFTHRIGERLDGLILIDPLGMQAILEAIGEPVPLPNGDDDDRLPAVLQPSEFARFVTVDVYGIYGFGFDDQRKRLLRLLGDAAFAHVVDGGWDAVEMSQAIAWSVEGRHLQVFSEDPEEQAAFARVGATGTFARHDAGDLLAVTANNAVGGKQDVHLGHAIEAVIELTDIHVAADGTVSAQRRVRVRTMVVNPLASDAMDLYVVRNCLVGREENRCVDGPPGWNRTWFSVWAPGTDALQAARDADGPILVNAGRFHGLRVIDHHLETPPRSSNWFEVELEGSVALDHLRDMKVYRLVWWSQSKAIPDLLDVQVLLPDGWEAVDADVSGGGDGRGRGVFGAGVPLSLDVADDRVSLRGTVTTDTELVVQLDPATDPDTAFEVSPNAAMPEDVHRSLNRPPARGARPRAGGPS